MILHKVSTNTCILSKRIRKSLNIFAGEEGPKPCTCTWLCGDRYFEQNSTALILTHHTICMACPKSWPSIIIPHNEGVSYSIWGGVHVMGYISLPIHQRFSGDNFSDSPSCWVWLNKTCSYVSLSLWDSLSRFSNY